MQLHVAGGMAALESQMPSVISGGVRWLLAAVSQLTVMWPFILQKARLVSLYCDFRVKNQSFKVAEDLALGVIECHI